MSVTNSVALASLEQVVVDLPGAEEQAPELETGSIAGSSGMMRWNSPVGELIEGADRATMPEQALGAHDDQWLAPWAKHLTTQAMKELRWGRHDRRPACCPPRTAARSARAVALECSGPWPSKPCGRNITKPTQPVPLVFRRGDELVDDDLGDIDEVAKLRFPSTGAHRGNRANSPTRTRGRPTSDRGLS